MDPLEKLAKKLGITIEELKNRIEKKKKEEEDKIEANAKKKNS
jgi:DNA-binding Lrp family transcriptional regulator|tara:strand:+ start:1287 stop:1415 length:129 start_codon:yes stop_codon:yes gene_type:complete